MLYTFQHWTMEVVQILYLINYHVNNYKIINVKIWIANHYNSRNANNIQNIAFLSKHARREHVIIMIKCYVSWILIPVIGLDQIVKINNHVMLLQHFHNAIVNFR